MSRMDRRTRRTLTLAGCALVTALMIFMLPVRLTAPFRIVFTEALGPLEQGAFSAGGDALAATGTLRDAFLAQDYRRKLELERRQLQNEAAMLAELHQAIARQRELLGAEGLEVVSSDVRRVAAPVTAYDADGTRQSIVIGVGTSGGIARGQAVCAMGAVVGTVEQAGPWRSRVRLITDPGSRLSCRLTSTRELVVLEGDGGPLCRVRWLDRRSKAARGDLLVTAPLDDLPGGRPIIPAGLPVAVLQQAAPGGENALFLDATASGKALARPGADVRRLEYVEVLVPRVPGKGA